MSDKLSPTPPETDGPTGVPSPEPVPPLPWWRTGLRWAERVLWIGVLAFAVVRLGPQVGALLGVGPALGSSPDFTLRTLDGETLGAEELRGRVAVVNFWATWCPPCRIEIPALQSIHEDYRDEGLVVLGISTDAGGVGAVRPFLEERGVTYPVAMADNAVRRAFGGITALPTTFIVDRDGVIRHRVFGFFAPPAMRAAVRRLLEEESAPGD